MAVISEGSVHESGTEDRKLVFEGLEGSYWRGSRERLWRAIEGLGMN